MMQDHAGHEPQKTANCDENVAAPGTANLPHSVVLIGMMGTGKTQLGRLLAKSMALPFADTDIEFEAAAGSSIADYFAKHGEDAFREGELKILERVLNGPPKIISAGGGIITLPAARALLKEKACAIWLTADPETLAKRCAGNTKRPLLQNGDPATILSELLEKRRAHYEEVAAFSVSTDKSVGDDALNTILKRLEAWAAQQ